MFDHHYRTAVVGRWREGGQWALRTHWAVLVLDATTQKSIA